MLASVASLLLIAASAAAQSTTTLCVAGLCLQGSSNISIGAVVSRNSDQFVLLPGTYSPTTEPQPLRDTLTNSASRLSYSPGFAPKPDQAGAQPVVFPVTIALQPGVLSTTSSLYRGQTAFHPVPDATNASIEASSQTGGSIVMSKDVWAAFKTGAGDSRLVLWDSVADLAELPSGAGASTLSLVDLQSTACSPACSGNGICTPQGKCVCPPGGGFQGSSCEACADGFFGPQCTKCPDDCDKCDDGATGSGKCLVPKVTNAPASCNCANGECGTGGACACNEGWADSPTGLKCSVCKEGYFKAANGNCQACFQGCSKCTDGRGTCTGCASGLTADGNDNRKCISPPGNCPDKTFPVGDGCGDCSPQCGSCTGAGSAACVTCADRLFMFDGTCVPVDSNGVCSGTKRVANPSKNRCDACPAGCSECNIPGFSSTSSVFDTSIKCTKCLPGFLLADGKCGDTCPTGSFISADGTCAPCDSSCSSCAGDAKFCLTCSGGKLAHEGACGSSCPSGTFSATGACLSCHGDCATCSGAGFDQCTGCSASRPVLQTSGTAQTGRCLPTCAKNQFFDTSSNKCQTCDSSCASCSGAGPGFCLSCTNPGQVVKGGSCVDAKCDRGSAVVPGLGACLSALVAAPFVDNTNPNAPSAPAPSQPGRRLAWWEILLMVLGCLFIVSVVLMCWRRRMRKKRAAQTAEFARKVQNRGFLARSVHWLGGKLFHHRVHEKDVDNMVARMRAQELERHKHEMEMLEVRAKAGSKFPIVHLHQHQDPNPPPPHDWDERSHYRYDSGGLDVDDRRTARFSDPSVYSVMTGVQPRRAPSPPPVPPEPAQPSSRFSTSTDGLSIFRTKSQNRLQKAPPSPPAVQPAYDPPPFEHVKQHRTGDSYESYHSQESTGSQSRNPFRR